MGAKDRDSRIPAGGQTEWRWSCKGRLQPPGRVPWWAGRDVSHTRAEESQEMPTRLGKGRSGQALQAEAAGGILGEEQEPDQLV